MPPMIRTLILLPLLIVAFASCGFSQTRIGLRAGMNIATLNIQDKEASWMQRDFSSYIAPAIGGIIEFDINNSFFIRAEPMYIQKGTRYNIPSDGIDRHIAVTCFQVPLALGYKFHLGNLTANVFFGPNAGLNLTDGYSATDMGLDAGIGIRKNMSALTTLLIDVRYSAGFNNINLEENGSERLYTRGIQPMLAVIFEI